MYIKHLKLENFRSFIKKDFEFSDELNIIIGENAVGKSSLLEAIILITDGYSPWTSDLNEIIYNSNLVEETSDDSYFRLEATISNNKKDTVISYYHSPTKKKFIIDGKATTRKKFFRFTSTNIFSPEQIELLMVSPSKRRDFLNRTIARIDPAYQDTLTNFEKILRQRNAYLKKLSKVFMESGQVLSNDDMLNFWTERFATENAKIVRLRAEYIDRISNSSKNFRVHYKPSLDVSEIASLLSTETLAANIYSQLCDKYKRDIILGYTHLGIHRDDWNIKTDKDIQRFGSRGEKRLALSRMIFEIQETQCKELGFYPIMLLDDISSELDDKNIAQILSSEYLSKQQVFITSIRKDSNIQILSQNNHKEFLF
jgi:DNA replication and repair protein RecF